MLEKTTMFVVFLIFLISIVETIIDQKKHKKIMLGFDKSFKDIKENNNLYNTWY
jgi:preprotein translocase subunit SecG